MHESATTVPPESPGFSRRMACILYEALLLTAVLFFAVLPYAMLTRGTDDYWVRPLLQLWLLVVAGVYFVVFWVRGGQTLAMKTWGIRLIGDKGQEPGIRQALVRYLFALTGLMAGGFGLLWALWDRDGLFLHDRLSGTRLVSVREKTGRPG
jgi:uncharacterized RDD family membrane protein YckC